MKSRMQNEEQLTMWQGFGLPAISIVRVFKRFLASGELNTRITYEQWLKWHAALNGIEVEE
jgi:hypothetical protein